MSFMRRVGPEPLGDSCGSAAFISRIRHRNNTTIKAAILDQSVIAGVGNIYADESLWQARIHPATRVHALSDAQLAVLLTSIKKVLALGIEMGAVLIKIMLMPKGIKATICSLRMFSAAKVSPVSAILTVLSKKFALPGAVRIYVQRAKCCRRSKQTTKSYLVYACGEALLMVSASRQSIRTGCRSGILK